MGGCGAARAAGTAWVGGGWLCPRSWRCGVAHRQRDGLLLALAATIAALGGCLSEDGDPFDETSTSSALENGPEVSGMAGSADSLDAHDKELGGRAPSAYEPGIPPEVDPGTPTY